MMLRDTRERRSVDAGGRAVVTFRCVRPLRRYRRLAFQSLLIAALVVTVTVLVSLQHRRPPPTRADDPISAAGDILRRLVRSVQRLSSGGGGGRPVMTGDDGSSGYLVTVVNGSRLTDVEFRSYGDAVDLRLIVLAYNRSESLAVCLESLEAAEYGKDDRVSLHVWIDGCQGDAERDDDDDAQRKTINVAQSFNFSHGTYHIHIRQQHVGVQVCHLKMSKKRSQVK